jgi:hypothetical protein
MAGGERGRCASAAWPGQVTHQRQQLSAVHGPLDAGRPRRACTARYDTGRPGAARRDCVARGCV